MLTRRWRKSPVSESGGCVEARLVGGHVQVRDTKDQGDGPVLTFNEREWLAFLAGVELGAFDLPGMPGRDR